MQRYVAAANREEVAFFASTTPPTVLTIAFITEQDLRARVEGATTGLPDDSLLCYVLLSGNFLSRDTPPGTAAVYYPRAAEVFDAHTGNLMSSISGPSVK